MALSSAAMACCVQFIGGKSIAIKLGCNALKPFQAMECR